MGNRDYYEDMFKHKVKRAKKGEIELKELAFSQFELILKRKYWTLRIVNVLGSSNTLIF